MKQKNTKFYYKGPGETKNPMTTGLRWLDTVFQGQYLPSLSINYVAINKDFGKIATTVVLDKDENL